MCFSIRSGSTLLAEDLRQWGAGAPTEPFQSPSYPAESDQGTAAYVERLLRDSPGEVFGFKATWGQTRTLLHRLHDEDPTHDFDDLEAVFPGIRYIHLIRRDKLAQAISAWRAIQSGVWHWPSGTTVDPGTPPYDFLSIRAQLLQILAEEWLWRAYFEQRGFPHLIVHYEDYIENRSGTLQGIVDWLGFGHPAAPSHALRVMRDQWSDGIATRVWRDLSQASDVDEFPRVDTLALGSAS
jgi:LPS sulfotransferase NodH